MIWKTHPIFNNYEVSNTGLIRSKDRVIIYNDGHTQSHKYNMQDKGKYYHKKSINLSSNKVEASNGSIGHKCPLCKTPIYSSSIMCINCRKKYWASHINGYKISPQQLIPILKLYNGNLSKTGRLFDTTSNTIVKFLKRNKLPYHSKDYSQH